MSEHEANRGAALWRQTSHFCWRDFEDDGAGAVTRVQIRHYEHVLETVELYRRQAAHMQPTTIQLLRDIEAGAVLYDADDTMRHTYTYIDDANRVHLRDSGLSLLFAIDCDYEQLRAETLPIIEQIKREALGNFRAAQESAAETYRRWNQETKARDKRKKAEGMQADTEEYVQPRLLELAGAQGAPRGA